MPETIDILQGRTKRALLKLLNPNGTEYDLTSAAVHFMVKPTFLAPDADALLNFHIDLDGTGNETGVTVGLSVGGTDNNVDPPVVYSGPESGVLTLFFSDESTANLNPGTYPWEVVALKDGNKDQLLSGDLVVVDTLITTPGVYA